MSDDDKMLTVQYWLIKATDSSKFRDHLRVNSVSQAYVVSNIVYSRVGGSNHRSNWMDSS
jgi:hypothetical protein